MVSYLVHYDTLLQNATTIITKCDSYFCTVKMQQPLLQNAAAIFVLFLDFKLIILND